MAQQIFQSDQPQSPQITNDEITIYRDLTFKIRHPDGKRQVPWPSDCEPSRETLGDNLAFQYIYEWQHNNQWNRAYELEVNQFMAIRYTIDLNGTENMEIQSAFPMKGSVVTIELQPFEREVVILISCDSKSFNQFSISGKWEQCNIDPVLQSEAITIANNKLSEYIPVHSLCDFAIPYTETIELISCFTAFVGVQNQSRIRTVSGSRTQ